MIVLQASELRILEKLDSIYMLEDPVDSNNDPLPLAEFIKLTFKEFIDQNIPNQEHKIKIKELPEDCPEDVKKIREDLIQLGADIGEAFAYETWLKQRKRVALDATEGDILMLINDNTYRSEDAAKDVANNIGQLSSIKKHDYESHEDFAVKMKNKFDAALSAYEIDLVDTEIDIPDIPSSAPPST